MKKTKTTSSRATGMRTDIRMSRSARATQSSKAQTNWLDMVKMLFETDPNGGRKAENRRLILVRHRLPESNEDASYGNDQIQYILFLMLTISTGEKRVQELYQRDFAHRCDLISKKYNLKEDEYWPEGQEPAEWQDLHKEFELEVARIHLKTLREYHQNEIAEMVESKGVDHLFEIIATIRTQFITLIKNFQVNSDQKFGSAGSIPEMLRSDLSS